MQVKRLYVRDFRNATESVIEFSDGVNAICGRNAAGKTNLLEAIFYFAAGKSFRNCNDRELIRFGCDSAVVRLDFESASGEMQLTSEFTKNGRRVIRMGSSAPLKMSDYLGLFRAVVFTPDHLSLIKGSPVCRRRFADIAICQSFPRYAKTLSEYNRVLAQKNALLKSKSSSDELFAVYNDRLASLAGLITVNRRKYLSRLENAAGAFLEDMSGGREGFALSYQTQSGDAETQEEVRDRYISLLLDNLHREKERMSCLYGTHKDDFAVYINKKNARMYASQGQQRSCVLALKLAEGELSKELTGEYPVFLLDDILSELDEGRQEFILSRIGARQVIITGCEENMFGRTDRSIYVEDGRICSFN